MTRHLAAHVVSLRTALLVSLGVAFGVLLTPRGIGAERADELLSSAVATRSDPATADDLAVADVPMAEAEVTLDTPRGHELAMAGTPGSLGGGGGPKVASKDARASTEGGAEHTGAERADAAALLLVGVGLVGVGLRRVAG